MDNIKTGALIRERRKEKGLTQRELAERLHVTDRAVSKWERGLCAPDIALLEPLSEALDLSVLELISGERVRTEEPEAKAEAAARSAIAYSRAELMRKLRTLRLRHVALAAAALAVLALIVFRGALAQRPALYLGQEPRARGRERRNSLQQGALRRRVFRKGRRVPHRGARKRLQAAHNLR